MGVCYHFLQNLPPATDRLVDGQGVVAAAWAYVIFSPSTYKELEASVRVITEVSSWFDW